MEAVMLDEYPRVGQSEPGHNVYHLDIYDFFQRLDPPSGFDLNPIDPMDYFITSGDAIQKVKYLSSVLWAYAGDARKVLNSIDKPTDEQIEFESECWKQAGAARKLLKHLIIIKDDNVFLETEWKESILTITPKNPRLPKV